MAKFCPSVPRSRGSTRKGGDSPQPMTIPSPVSQAPCDFSTSGSLTSLLGPAGSALGCGELKAPFPAPRGLCSGILAEFGGHSCQWVTTSGRQLLGVAGGEFWKSSLGVDSAMLQPMGPPPPTQVHDSTTDLGCPHLIPNPSDQAGGHRPDPLLRARCWALEGVTLPCPSSYHAWLPTHPLRKP